MKEKTAAQAKNISMEVVYEKLTNYIENSKERGDMRDKLLEQRFEELKSQISIFNTKVTSEMKDLASLIAQNDMKVEAVQKQVFNIEKNDELRKELEKERRKNFSKFITLIATLAATVAGTVTQFLVPLLFHISK